MVSPATNTEFTPAPPGTTRMFWLMTLQYGDGGTSVQTWNGVSDVRPGTTRTQVYADVRAQLLALLGVANAAVLTFVLDADGLLA
ncbi:hypothetical protein H3146_05965 [Streptomyces sp. OF3]|uniref:Uncharacterized protein n=1 Tax=Streptomyces alkaliterrae TaxID=2213162 RepID=A0A7W3ZLM2_9ACTN|nr:hypothetical protein [Streptomyces alkaliterrae]MBB1252913.1 hypothetical protein [Streptomyces alkaliterrae]